MTIDLEDQSLSSIHIIGIGGAGMSAIATVLKRMGKNITGSDLKNSAVTERLVGAGISVMVPHSPDVITSSIDLVVRSTAINDDNSEVIAAKGQSIPVISRAEMLSVICAHENSIGIAGSHGKTTTTSMVTSIARAAGMNPSFMIGGDVNEIGTNAQYNAGSLLIVEADESDRTFLDLSLRAAIVTNIENDHLESYHDSFDELKDAFYDFVLNIDGPVVICVDEPNARDVADRARQKREVITVGSSDADWTYDIVSAERGGIIAKIMHEAQELLLELAVPGAHNARNALCAFALMHALGVDNEHCLKGLAAFGGVARRFQFRGTHNGVNYVDDYAHLPTEIEATLSAAHDGNFSRVIAIFQPHRYSRTQALYKEFAQSLSSADIIAVCEIYSAGEEPRPGVSSALIVDELVRCGHNATFAVRHSDDVVDFVSRFAQPGDLVLTLGAGDVTMYPDVIQNALQLQSEQRL